MSQFCLIAPLFFVVEIFYEILGVCAATRCKYGEMFHVSVSMLLIMRAQRYDFLF